MAEKFRQIGEKYKPLNARTSTNTRQGKHKENHMKAPHNKIPENQS